MSPFLVLLLVPGLLAIPLQDEEKSREARAASGEGLIEGDIIVPADEIAAIQQGQNYAGGRSLKWPGGVVPYTMHSSVRGTFLNHLLGRKSTTEKAIISAMKEWQKKTCIRFKRRTTEKDYVEFVKGSGCSSYIGRTGQGKQQISIGRGCRKHGIVVHEIGHALGLFHEQSRPNRDNFVEIIQENIQPGAEDNFQKYSHGTIGSFRVPYDYSSIMHYPKDAFAKRPGLATIRAKKPGVTFGQRDHLSSGDVKKITLYYKCSS